MEETTYNIIPDADFKFYITATLLLELNEDLKIKGNKQKITYKILKAC